MPSPIYARHGFGDAAGYSTPPNSPFLLVNKMRNGDASFVQDVEDPSLKQLKAPTEKASSRKIEMPIRIIGHRPTPYEVLRMLPSAGTSCPRRE